MCVNRDTQQFFESRYLLDFSLDWAPSQMAGPLCKATGFGALANQRLNRVNHLGVQTREMI